MAGKRLLFKSAAREKVLSGATALADAVRITLVLTLLMSGCALRVASAILAYQDYAK
jgi:hypothetical protein